MLKRCVVVLFLSVLLVGFCGLGYAGIDFESQIPEIPLGAISIDGSPDDWEVLSQNGTQFFTLQDDSGDSDCEPGTDISAIYLARDGQFLYWRMDNYDGFSFGDSENKYPMIHFYDTHGVQVRGVKWQMWGAFFEERCGAILEHSEDSGWTWVERFTGCDYGKVGQIAEGKIPLPLLDGFEINHVLGFYYAGKPNTPCDILVYTVPEPVSAEFFVQHRRYEDGREFNQLGINLFDGSGNTIPEDIIDYVELIDPDGLPVTIYDFRFETLRMALTGYDGNSGQWRYPFNQEGEIFRDWADYAGTIQEELKIGTYKLKVSDIYGKFDNAEFFFNFNGQVELPIIKGNSFKKKLDKEGNLIWEWKVPYYIDPSLRTTVKAWIGIYQGKESVGIFQTSVPTHMGRVFVPNDVLQKVMAEGDRFELVIQLRTSDNNNRSYSKAMKLNLMKLMVGNDDDDDEDGEWFEKFVNKKSKGK